MPGDMIPDLVLMAGQSNMVGYRTSERDLAPKWRGEIRGAEIWVKDTWQPLRISAGYQRRGFGPELSFAQEWTSGRRQPLRIVKVAQNATYLAREWSPDGDGGALYRRLVKQAIAALETGPVRLRGLVWMQGEADALQADLAAEYRDRFGRFVERLRLDLGAPDLPVVAGRIDPPTDPFAYRDVVREALSQPAVTQYRSVQCDDLPRQSDGLHYSPRGLGMLGRRFAVTLHELDTDRAIPAPVRRWMWNSPRYQAWLEFPEPEPEAVIVSMPHAVVGNGFREEGFGQRYFLKRGMPAVYLRETPSNWFQDAEILAVARRIRDCMPKGARLVTYGASMGAYGALLLSGELQADKVVAIAPQYSIDRKVVPWETRWKRAFRRIGFFVHRLEDHVSGTARKIVLFDPISQDRKQIAMFPSDATWELLALPFASHQVLRMLLDVDALGPLLADVLREGPDGKSLWAHVHRRRRDSKVYWLSIAELSSPRRPRLARYAIERFSELGGSDRKAKKLRILLDESTKV